MHRMWRRIGADASASRLRAGGLAGALALASSPVLAQPVCSPADGAVKFTHVMPKPDPAWTKPGEQPSPAWLKGQRDFLTLIDATSGWQRSASGLRFRRDGEPSTGTHSTPGCWVKVRYIGRLADGTEFHRSPGDEPIDAPLAGVIRGWQEGVPMMRAGEHWRFVVPPELGYGDRGKGPIPGGAVLIFEITLVAVETPTLEQRRNAPNPLLRRSD